LLRWFGCGLLLAIGAMAKGPQPLGFFGLGVTAYVLINHCWRDLPGLIVCAVLPGLALIAWGAAIYQPGDEAAWLGYMRIGGVQSFVSYLAAKISFLATLAVDLTPALLLAFFARRPTSRPFTDTRPAADIVTPLILYSSLCTVALTFWPGANTRYAMPIAPSL